MMKDIYHFVKNEGLKGGPNFVKMSITGYRADSPDRHNPTNTIPSGRISMHNVPHPVIGTDNFGNSMMMMPEGEYQFPGNTVHEIPVGKEFKSGGWIKDAIKHPGAFTAKANAAGMSVQEYANYVLRDNSNADSTTKHQAVLAKNLKKMAKLKSKKQFGGKTKGLSKLTTDDYIQSQKEAFKNYTTRNTFNALAAEEADNIAAMVTQNQAEPRLDNQYQIGGEYGYAPQKANIDPWVNAYGAMKQQSQNDFQNLLGTAGEMTASIYADPGEMKLKKLKTEFTNPEMKQEYKNQAREIRKQMKNNFNNFGNFVPNGYSNERDYQQGDIEYYLGGQPVTNHDLMPFMQPGGELQSRLAEVANLKNFGSDSKYDLQNKANAALKNTPSQTDEKAVKGNYVPSEDHQDEQNMQQRNQNIIYLTNLGRQQKMSGFPTQGGYQPNYGYNLYPGRWQKNNNHGVSAGPAIAYNPMNTYLSKVDKRRGLFGRNKPRRVIMEFSHYGAPGMPNMQNNQRQNQNNTKTFESDTPTKNTPPVYNSENKSAYRRTNSGNSPLNSTHGQMDMLDDINNKINQNNLTPEMLNSMMQMMYGGAIPTMDFGGGVNPYPTQPTYPGTKPFDSYTAFFQKGGINEPTGDVRSQPSVTGDNSGDGSANWGKTKAIWGNTLSGNPRVYADAGLAGMSFLSSIGEGNERKQLEEQIKARTMGDSVFQPTGAGDVSRGTWTVNAGNMRPNQQIPVQFQGNNMGMIGSNMYQAKMGGTMNYEEGGIYELSEDEINHIMKMGGKVEYID